MSAEHLVNCLFFGLFIEAMIGGQADERLELRIYISRQYGLGRSSIQIRLGTGTTWHRDLVPWRLERLLIVYRGIHRKDMVRCQQQPRWLYRMVEFTGLFKID
jgi:hypothetical protein